MKRTLVNRLGRTTAFQTIGILLLAAIFAGTTTAPVALAGPSSGGARSRQGSAPPADKAQPVDLNTADVDKLVSIPGIGKALAQRIVDYRKEHGPFRTVDELVNVRGIGEKSLEKIRDYVTVGTKS